MNKLILPNGHEWQPSNHPKALPADAQSAIMKDALDALDAEFKPSTEKRDVVIQKGMDVRAEVIREIRPLLTDPKLVLDDVGQKNIHQLIANEYANRFARWDKDDVVWLLTVLHTENLWKKIREQAGF